MCLLCKFHASSFNAFKLFNFFLLTFLIYEISLLNFVFNFSWALYCASIIFIIASATPELANFLNCFLRKYSFIFCIRFLIIIFLISLYLFWDFLAFFYFLNLFIQLRISPPTDTLFFNACSLNQSRSYLSQ